MDDVSEQTVSSGFSGQAFLVNPQGLLIQYRNSGLGLSVLNLESSKKIMVKSEATKQKKKEYMRRLRANDSAYRQKEQEKRE